MEKFSHEAPIKPSVIVSFRKRLTAEYLMEVNEYILETSGVTKEHEPRNESKNATIHAQMTLKILERRFLMPPDPHLI